MMNWRLGVLTVLFFVIVLVINVYYSMDYKNRREEVEFKSPDPWIPNAGTDF